MCAGQEMREADMNALNPRVRGSSPWRRTRPHQIEIARIALLTWTFAIFVIHCGDEWRVWRSESCQ
jgi:hypothetical protein